MKMSYFSIPNPCAASSILAGGTTIGKKYLTSQPLSDKTKLGFLPDQKYRQPELPFCLKSELIHV